jgi:mono/diheme cytochrome c family protein
MKFLLAMAAICVTAFGQARAEMRPDETAIRAGKNIALTSCIACHVVFPNQAAKPVLGPGIPSFAEIAARPDVTADTLRASMKVARWHDPALAATLLPMSRISDAERGQVASYILSLRAQQQSVQ